MSTTGNSEKKGVPSLANQYNYTQTIDDHMVHSQQTVPISRTGKRVQTFTYMGSPLAEDGELGAELTKIYTEQVEELEESVCNHCMLSYRKKKRDDQEEGVQDSGKTDTCVDL